MLAAEVARLRGLQIPQRRPSGRQQQQRCGGRAQQRAQAARTVVASALSCDELPRRHALAAAAALIRCGDAAETIGCSASCACKAVQKSHP